MTDNWNALTDEQRTKALAENVLGWEIGHMYDHPDNTHKYWVLQKSGDYYGYGCGKGFSRVLGHSTLSMKQKDFNPLTDLNHTALLWAALSEEQKDSAVQWLFNHTDEKPQLLKRFAVVMIDTIFSDPLKLSQAIYTVTVGQEEITDA